jgi:hypothetical protein
MMEQPTIAEHSAPGVYIEEEVWYHSTTDAVLAAGTQPYYVEPQNVEALLNQYKIGFFPILDQPNASVTTYLQDY